MNRIIKSALTAYLTISFAACATHKVIAVDAAGKPIANAAVEAVSPSINYGKQMTGPDGTVALSDSYTQAPKWLNVQKPGYDSVQIAFPTTWPATIILRETPKP